MPSPDAVVREALERVLRDEGDRLYGLALRVTREPDLARDAVQSAFAAALAGAEAFRGEAELSTWLYRITYNKAIDLLRTRAREVPLPEEDGDLGPGDVALAHAPSAWADPERALDTRRLRQDLEAALAALTPLQRAVFDLREAEGLPGAAVAERLGLSEGAVRVQLHRARLKLRARLATQVQGAVR